MVLIRAIIKTHSNNKGIKMKKLIAVAILGLSISASAISAPWEYEEGKEYVDQEVSRANEYTAAVGEQLQEEIHGNRLEIYNTNEKVDENKRAAAAQAVSAERNANVYTDSKVLSVSNRLDHVDHQFRQMDSKFSALNDKVDDNRKKASAGISSVAAMANIPFNANQTFAIGAGYGAHDGESAIAVGANWNINQTISVRATMGHDSMSKKTYGAGVVFGW